MHLPTGGIKRQWRAVGRLPFYRGRTGFAIGALQVGGIKIEPAPLFEVAPLRRGVAVVVVAVAIECGQCIPLARQRLEHSLTPGDVGTPAIRGHGIHPQGVERMPLGRYQVPAAVTLFGAEKAFGLERRPGQQATVRVQLLLATLCQPAFELLLLAHIGRLELLVIGNLFRPMAAGGLAIGIDQLLVGRLVGLVVILDADPLDQQVLRHLGVGDTQADRHHLLEVERAGAAGQQQALAAMVPGHGRAGAHALAQRRTGRQRYHHGLCRPGR